MGGLTLDLFAGAGGWEVAGQRLGLASEGCEIDPVVRRTRSAAGLDTPHRNAWMLHGTATYDGITAGPPCQTFSVAGDGAGREALDTVVGLIRDGSYADLYALRQFVMEHGDERTALVLMPLFYVRTIRPRWAAFEQVSSVLPVWDACAQEMAALGYHVWTGLLHAEQYGVPQTRTRAVLIASLEHPVGQPTPTHSRYYPHDPERLDMGVHKWVSMAEALGLEPGGLLVSNYNTGGETGNPGYRPVEHLSTTITSKTNRNRIVPEWCWKRPATTVVGSFRPDLLAGPHYRVRTSRQKDPDSVLISPAEAGVLQTFRADWPWQGAKNERYQQIGNAIPPLLAEAVIKEAL